MTDAPNYLRYYVLPDGEKYRAGFIENRVWEVSNPTVYQMECQIDKLNPGTVLEIGCGYGRLMKPLLGKPYAIYGIDVSSRMLSACPPELSVYEWDIVNAPTPTVYDIGFARGVFTFFVESNIMESAVKNALLSVSNALIIWELPEVLDEIRGVSQDKRLVLCPIDKASKNRPIVR